MVDIRYDIRMDHKKIKIADRNVVNLQSSAEVITAKNDL